jgi:hypothetical protein
MTATNLVIEIEKSLGFHGHSIERRRLEVLALIRLYAEKAIFPSDEPDWRALAMKALDLLHDYQLQARLTGLEREKNIELCQSINQAIERVLQ